MKISGLSDTQTSRFNLSKNQLHIRCKHSYQRPADQPAQALGKPQQGQQRDRAPRQQRHLRDTLCDTKYGTMRATSIWR